MAAQMWFMSSGIGDGIDRDHRLAPRPAQVFADNRGGIMTAAKQNLQSLRDELGALAAEVTKLMETSDQYGSEELKSRLDRIRTKFEGAVSDNGGRHDAIHEFSKNIADGVEHSLRERPIATLALAVGLGFIVGAALHR